MQFSAFAFTLVHPLTHSYKVAGNSNSPKIQSLFHFPSRIREYYSDISLNKQEYLIQQRHFKQTTWNGAQKVFGTSGNAVLPQEGLINITWQLSADLFRFASLLCVLSLVLGLWSSLLRRSSSEATMKLPGFGLALLLAGKIGKLVEMFIWEGKLFVSASLVIRLANKGKFSFFS